MNIQPWQLDFLDKMTKYKGRGLIQITGRNIGKSQFSAQALKRIMDDLTNRPVENLILSERKVHGARYYCVEPVGGNWLDMEIWALDTFGSAGSLWDDSLGRWLMNDRKFWFREEKDRNWFIMRWS